MMNRLTDNTDMLAELMSSSDQLHGSLRSSARQIFLLHAVLPTLLAQVFAQQLSGVGVKDTDEELVPSHMNFATNPAWRQTIVGSFHLDTAVQVYDSSPILVIAKRLQGQREQSRLFFGEHGGDLPLGGAMDPG